MSTPRSSHTSHPVQPRSCSPASCLAVKRTLALPLQVALRARPPRCAPTAAARPRRARGSRSTRDRRRTPRTHRASCRGGTARSTRRRRRRRAMRPRSTSATSRPPRAITPSRNDTSASCQCRSTPLRGIESRSTVWRRRISSGEICASHWNGVCALGTNVETETATRRPPRCAGGVASRATSRTPCAPARRCRRCPRRSRWEGRS